MESVLQLKTIRIWLWTLEGFNEAQAVKIHKFNPKEVGKLAFLAPFQFLK